MHISSAATALPPNYYPQPVLIEAFRKYWGGRLDRFDILERLHAATQVDGRFRVHYWSLEPFPGCKADQPDGP